MTFSALAQKKPLPYWRRLKARQEHFTAGCKPCETPTALRSQEHFGPSWSIAVHHRRHRPDPRKLYVGITSWRELVSDVWELADDFEVVLQELLAATPWTNQNGKQHNLKADDFMVVAPYNDQVRAIRDRLAQDARTAGVPVGTVDKFQGGEAAVVFFSMATSTGQDMTRGADFLFSRNRLNVAISRARCLAYLVCTEELLNARARNVDDMRLIATLNAFVEWAQRPHGQTPREAVDPAM